ncbi:MAG: hypothetical protein ACRECH_16045, partial [Nitrososphaerales archaeon]
EEEPDWELYAGAWMIVSKVNELREKVDRWTRREVRDYDMMLELLDDQLRRRGIGGGNAAPSSPTNRP